MIKLEETGDQMCTAGTGCVSGTKCVSGCRLGRSIGWAEHDEKAKVIRLVESFDLILAYSGRPV